MEHVNEAKHWQVVLRNGETACSGNLLRALTTTLVWKHSRGTQVIPVPNGNKVKDWTIRSVIL